MRDGLCLDVGIFLFLSFSRYDIPTFLFTFVKDIYNYIVIRNPILTSFQDHNTLYVGFWKSRCICALFFAKSYIPNKQSNIVPHNKDVGMGL